jgi:rSAM/selenodomain-associated transferase 2
MPRSNTERIQFSVIIPVLNESRRIEEFLASLRKQTSNFETEIIVVDGGSDDDTLQRARAHCDHATQSPRGRARQQNVGANIAMGDTLVFLHADTTLPADAFSLIANALNPRCAWGRFDVTLDSRDARLRLVATMMNLRSRSTGIATGDQCIFVRRRTFIAIGGFPDQALMEDIEISKRLKRVSSPACLRAKVCTSARRWEKHGIFRTIALMWWLRFAYWLGVSPATLAQWYGNGKSEAAR